MQAGRAMIAEAMAERDATEKEFMHRSMPMGWWKERKRAGA
jgi:hypothetical protein